MIIIYGLSSSEDNRIRYIGQTKSSAEQRRRSHLKESLTRNGVSQTYKCRWVRKVLSDGFQIQITVLKENAIYNIDEIDFICRYKKMGVNLVNGTGGGDHAFELSTQAKKKMSERRKGTKASAETRALLSSIRKGRKQSPDWIEKRVTARKMAKKPYPEEAKKRIREARMKQVFTDEAKIKSKIGVQKWWDERRGELKTDEHYRRLIKEEIENLYKDTPCVAAPQEKEYNSVA